MRLLRRAYHTVRCLLEGGRGRCFTDEAVYCEICQAFLGYVARDTHLTWLCLRHSPTGNLQATNS
jgi:hypothetical protein